MHFECENLLENSFYSLLPCRPCSAYWLTFSINRYSISYAPWHSDSHTLSFDSAELFICWISLITSNFPSSMHAKDCAWVKSLLHNYNFVSSLFGYRLIWGQSIRMKTARWVNAVAGEFPLAWSAFVGILRFTYSIVDSKYFVETLCRAVEPLCISLIYLRRLYWIWNNV